ncbi:hypothetical protein GGF32_004858 [Allomyces javanicus]|nr:hypothetical protein GGF32_004858 [Allomyces javanicus]
MVKVVDKWWEPLPNDEELASEKADVFPPQSSRLGLYFLAVRFAREAEVFQYDTFVVRVFRAMFDGLQAASGKPRIDETMHALAADTVNADLAGNAVQVQREELPAWT